MDDLTKEFLAESLEGLDRMDQCLTELEVRPGDEELLAEIFRAVHTIKGTTGFLGFGRLEKLAHAGEHLLGLLRDGRLTANQPLIGGLLKLMDGLRAILRLIEETGTEGKRAEDEDSALIALMKELGACQLMDSSEKKEAAPADFHLDSVDDDLSWAEATSSATPWPAAAAGPRAGDRRSPALEAGTPGVGLHDKTLRVDVEVLNRMMNQVGELVLTRNQILQSHADAGSFQELSRRLDAVTADLRETVMQARMQPVGHLFGKFPRMVRDLALSCNKSVRVEFCGQETGLDKSLLEAIKDPLTHAVRNAIDHGIEGVRERALAGKPLEGLLSMRAFHQSGSVVIEVVDDGAGISVERVRRKAVDRGILTEEQAASMTGREVQQLIFLPGFSTAPAVTHISGRGVGMDVVRANVEKVGGTVEVDSHAGRGTVLRLRVPLTLAIVPALIVRSGGQSFCLPQGALAELVYVPRREAEAAVERIGEAQFYRLRDRLLPTVWLDEMLSLEREEASQERGFYLAVLEAEGCRFGLAVDDLMAPEEIVVKPLSAVLRGIGLFSGATVLGSGMLAMILDVAATAMRANVRSAAVTSVSRAAPLKEENAPGPSFLIFEDEVHSGGGQGRGIEQRALPLEAVERIESVTFVDLEYAGGRTLLQYRGHLLMLEDAGGVLKELGEDESATVLICRRAGGQRVGIVVRRVLDIASGTLMQYDANVCDEHLAMVKERLTVVHRGFAVNAPDTAGSDRHELLKEVA